MKPVAYKPKNSSSFLGGNFTTNFGSKNTVSKIQGSVKKLGTKYSQALVVLYNKSGLLPIAVRRPNADGNYQFLGLNSDLTCMAICIPADTDFNALIIDRIVPA